MAGDAQGLSGLRARFDAPGPLFSALLSVPEPAIATILGLSGYDYVIIDVEHGPFTLTSIRACVEALANTPSSVMVRTASGSDVEIKQVLDLGVDGVQIPSVSTPDEAASAVRAARYPPEGVRGIGAGRATRYGLDTRRYLCSANASIAVVVMIEDRCGVDNAAAIAAVRGVDGIVIGPMDLSADLGVTGELSHEALTDATRKLIAGTLAAGTKVGTGCSPDQVGLLAAEGMTLFTCFMDTIDLGRFATQALHLARSSLEERKMP